MLATEPWVASARRQAVLCNSGGPQWIAASAARDGERQILTETELFWSQVDDSEGPGRCWPWEGTTSKGKGYFYRGGRRREAHRVAYELAHGDLLQDMWVTRTCGDKMCCNPDHLKLETRSEVLSRKKKPEDAARGDVHGSTKLTEHQVSRIKRIRQDGVAIRHLAHIFKTSESTISRILAGKTWAHVDPAP